MAWKNLRALVLAALLSGCAAAAPPYDPFRIGKEDFRQRIHTIALLPLRLPSDIENPDAVRQKFEGLVRGRLEQFGFSTLPSKEGGEILERVRTESGGAFNPITGAIDEAKAKQIQQKTRDEIARRFHADAVLQCSILVVRASFGNGVAGWAGTSQRIETGGSLTLRLLGGVSVSGSVGATSLAVAMVDVAGNDLYLKQGGIEALSVYGAGGFQQKPLAQLFQDEERNLAAVDLALKELNPNPVPAKK